MTTADAPVAADTDDAPTAAVFQSGGAYRAQIKRGDNVVWQCPHLHFTDHSAKVCAERHLRELAAGGGEPMRAGGVSVGA
jgi:hypothetical protein